MPSEKIRMRRIHAGADVDFSIGRAKARDEKDRRSLNRMTNVRAGICWHKGTDACLHIYGDSRDEIARRAMNRRAQCSRGDVWFVSFHMCTLKTEH